MEFLDHFEILSQSYLIEGNGEGVLQKLIPHFEKKHNIKTSGNPDFLVRNFVTFTIEDAREIKELASRRDSTTEKRIFIIQAGAFTREASNALLKTLEEPGENTHFFLVTPSLSRVLPTIISRCQVVHDYSSVASSLILPEKFLSFSTVKRLAYVKDVMGKLDKEEVAKSDIHSFIEELIRYQYEQVKTTKATKLKNLAQSADIASYARDTSASLKMILEYLALNA
ncbi:MAG: hypothetical protein WC629_02685 [Candidatus Paceibacterota bacterium]|jgi:DNA polymerase-3 subunit delta'